MSLLAPRKAALKGKLNELSALKLIYEEGCATACQIGAYFIGPNFNPRFSQHHRVLRRLHRLSQVAWFKGPIKDRLFYITSEGAARIKEEGGISAECWLGYTDYHSGRSGLTILHDLSVIDCRLSLQDKNYDWISKSIIQSAWPSPKEKPQYIPDAIVGRASTLEYWPGKIPFAIEYERSSKSWTNRALKIFRSTSYLGFTIAGVVLVTRPSQVDLWQQSLEQLNKNPTFEILTRRGKQTLTINPSLLRFFSVCTIAELDSALLSSRAAHREDSVAGFPWNQYYAWISWWDDIVCPT